MRSWTIENTMVSNFSSNPVSTVFTRVSSWVSNPNNFLSNRDSNPSNFSSNLESNYSIELTSPDLYTCRSNTYSWADIQPMSMLCAGSAGRWVFGSKLGEEANFKVGWVVAGLNHWRLDNVSYLSYHLVWWEVAGHGDSVINSRDRVGWEVGL